MDSSVLVGLAGVIASAAPIVIAGIGETLTEKSGVLNLSVNGIILLSAMTGFVCAHLTDNLWLGYLTGMLVGVLIGLLLSVCTIVLEQSQVAVGLVLAFLCKDLSYFLGNEFMGLQAPVIHSQPIPFLSSLPIIGTLFFKHNVLVYISFLTIAIAMLWLRRTRFGLIVRAVGERPEAAFGRGIRVNKVRFAYTLIGSALVGLAGPVYSLGLKPGWKGTLTGLDGIGWIVLAITIFGGWNPLKVALGAYLFEFLRWLGLVLQTSLPGVPSQVLQVAPFPLMILTLILVNIRDMEWYQNWSRLLPDTVRMKISSRKKKRDEAPSSLGIPFNRV